MEDSIERWRLVLGGSSDGTGHQLQGEHILIDKALEAVYDNPEERQGGLGKSSPKVSRWLGEIREFFP